MTDKEEIKDGLVEEFYDNGQLKGKGFFKNDKLDGKIFGYNQKINFMKIKSKL